MFHRSLVPISLVSGFFQTCLAAEDTRKPISYYQDIRPIFQANCVGCHQPSKDNGSYVMTDFKRLLAGGEEAPAIIAGKPDESYLIDEITPDPEGSAEMPKNPLSPPWIPPISVIHGLSAKSKFLAAIAAHPRVSVFWRKNASGGWHCPV